MMSSPPENGHSAIHARIRQQEVVAELGQRALETDDLDGLLHDAAAAVAETLAAEYAKVLELLPDGEELFLGHGVGWQGDYVGEATVPTDRDSQAGYTLLSAEPVVVDDLGAEDRFSGPDLLVEHDVVSGISVVIGSVDDPWGVLGVHATEPREFTRHDANFVQSVANVLASAIENEATHSRLRETHERISSGVMSLNDDCEFTHVNQQAEERLGYDAEELLGENIWELFPSVAGTEFEARYREAMETQEAVSFEEYYPPFDAWFEEHVHPSETGLSVYFRDVTEQKQLEAELEEIYGRISDAFFALDEDWRFTHLNERAHELINPGDRSLIGERVWEEFPAATERTFKERYETAMHEQETVSFEEYYPEPLDAWFEVNAYPSETGLSVYFRDVTGRKEREAEFRMVAENIEEIIWIADPETMEYQYISPAFDDIWGISRKRLYDDPGSYVQWVHPDDRDRVRRNFDELPDEPLDETFRVVRPDGETRWLRVRGKRVENDEGIARVIGIGQELTEQKAYEHKLEESNERLEQFAYAASHDLQEPLRMVTSYLQLVENRYGDELDEDGEEFLAFAIDGAERMREMIDGLLEYSRVDTEGDPFEPVDLNAIVEDVREDLRMRIEESGADITVGDLPRANGDARQLRRVFQNLFENAISYSGDEPPRIRVDAERRGRKWQLSVRDEGIGIDPDDQDRIFEVFERLHSREERSGTGIGLALCRRIVERHDGRIEVDSEPGEGTTFSFTLPTVDEW